jgi:hypothetical protein
MYGSGALFLGLGLDRGPEFVVFRRTEQCCIFRLIRAAILYHAFPLASEKFGHLHEINPARH